MQNPATVTESGDEAILFCFGFRLVSDYFSFSRFICELLPSDIEWLIPINFCNEKLIKQSK